MGTVGVAAEEANQIWLFIQAILLLGNVDFGSSEAAKVSNLQVLLLAQALLGFSALQANLETRSLTVRGVTTTIPLTPASAALARDAMAKIMCARLLFHPPPDPDPKL
jgi:myosin heavy subunit